MEVFISEVQKRRVLWDKSSAQYKDRRTVDKEWDGVATSVGISKEEAKKKWRNLRDIFMRELKKIPSVKSGSAQENAPVYDGKWQHFSSMLFLKDTLTPRSTEGNLTQHSTGFEDNINTESGDYNTEQSNFPISVTESSLPISINESPLPSRPKRRKINESSDLEAKFLEIENKKLEALQQDEDADSLFLRSLKPYFTKFTPVQNVRVKSQILNIVLQEMQNNELQGRSTSSTSIYSAYSTGPSSPAIVFVDSVPEATFDNDTQNINILNAQ